MLCTQVVSHFLIFPVALHLLLHLGHFGTDVSYSPASLEFFQMPQANVHHDTMHISKEQNDFLSSKSKVKVNFYNFILTPLVAVRTAHDVVQRAAKKNIEQIFIVTTIEQDITRAERTTRITHLRTIEVMWRACDTFNDDRKSQ